MSQLFYWILILSRSSMYHVISEVIGGRGMLHQLLPNPKTPDFTTDIFSWLAMQMCKRCENCLPLLASKLK